jgi:hypothetical protein
MIALAHWVVIGGVALLIWAGSLYAWPFGPCGRCNGTGRNRGSNARRFGTCRRCDGRGRVQRVGSRTVHRLAWTIRGEVLRELDRRRDRKAAERSAHPRNLADKDH